MNKALKHWSLVRLSSLPLVLLFFYFITQMEFITTHDRTSFIAWLKQPSALIAVLVFIACGYFHATLGVDEIIEDYIHDDKMVKTALLANRLFFIILGLVSMGAALFIGLGKC
jgi:succinate dehydrogenase / fumarate reductase membrane anchor subunit